MDTWSRSKQSELGMHSLSVPQSPHECRGAQGCGRTLPTLAPYQPGDLGSGQHVCPLPAKQHPSAVWESIFESQKSKPPSPLESPRGNVGAQGSVRVTRASWERGGSAW